MKLKPLKHDTCDYYLEQIDLVKGEIRQLKDIKYRTLKNGSRFPYDARLRQLLRKKDAARIALEREARITNGMIRLLKDAGIIDE